MDPIQPIPLEVTLGERRDRAPQLSPADDLGLLLLFTVDTECSVLRQPNPNSERVVDELIFGDFGNGRPPGGIGLHMDLLEHFGFRGCFFLDVLMEYQHGRRALERTIEAIAERGHEVQLHIHPTHLHLADDPRLADLAGGLMSPDEDVFRRLVDLSVDLFERRVGHRPIAYRAGGFRIADMHFPVLEEFGLRIDSSMHPYYNSRVCDWMRTRTQPFWVGGVLEVPPSLVMLGDDPGAWKLRGFIPNLMLAEPVSQLASKPGSAPCVATYVSHSFELLRRRETWDTEEIAAFVERLRPALPPDVAAWFQQHPPEKVRTFGEELDDSKVASAADVLRRIADRPDARCVTYGELAKLVDRFWAEDRHPSVDPIALRAGRHGGSGAVATRIYSRDLLAHLADRESLPAVDGDASDRSWIEGLEECGEPEFADRVESASDELEPGEGLNIRLRTLGVASPARRGALPPFAELVFPAAALRSVADEEGADWADSIPWDVPTFRAWFEDRGFEVLRERRLRRRPEELAAIDRFGEKLDWLDRLELQTEAVEMVLRRASPGAAPDRSAAAVPLFDGMGSEGGPAVVLPDRVDPLLLPAAAAELYESMHPGQELRVRVPDEPAPASRTTILLALMRAGLEVLDRGEGGHRLVRPLELADIMRIRGPS